MIYNECGLSCGALWASGQLSISHYCDATMGAVASQITSPTIVYSTVHSGTDQRKHQSSVSLVFVRGIHRWPVNSPHKWPVTRKMFSFGDAIMTQRLPAIAPLDTIINCYMQEVSKHYQVILKTVWYKLIYFKPQKGEWGLSVIQKILSTFYVLSNISHLKALYLFFIRSTYRRKMDDPRHQISQGQPIDQPGPQ